MTTLRLRTDFNGLFGKYLCLSHGDTCRDESGAEVPLRAGMQVTAFDEDFDEEGRQDNLVASGIVEPAVPGLVGHRSRWVLHIDEHGVRHESDLRAE
jgi:hypothetical protein